MGERSGRWFSPTRLRVARQRRGLQKKALAELLRVSPAMVTLYEDGAKEPDPEVVQSLVWQLRFPREFYCSSEFDGLRAEAVSFRARRSLTAQVRDKTLASNEIASDIISPTFRSLVRLPETDIPDLTGADPEEAAQKVRDSWGLGQAPVPNVVHLLEAKGVEIYWLRELSPCLDAVSYWRNGKPFVTMNLGKAGERGRMDAAHELGHLVLHRHKTVEGKQEEDEADRFAAAFLLPRNQFRQECPRLLNFSQLLQLKKRWKTSIGAMIYRGHELGIYSPWIYGKAYRELSAKGWRTNEPEAIEREHSSLQQQIFDKLAGKGMTASEWESKLHLPWDDIEELTPEATRLKVQRLPTPQWSVSHLWLADGGMA